MLISVLHFLMITLTISQSVFQCVEESFKALKSVETDCLTCLFKYTSELSECYYKVGKWLEITVTCLKDKNQ